MPLDAEHANTQTRPLQVANPEALVRSKST